jgi:flagellar hook-length control protein FliK
VAASPFAALLMQRMAPPATPPGLVLQAAIRGDAATVSPADAADTAAGVENALPDLFPLLDPKALAATGEGGNAKAADASEATPPGLAIAASVAAPIAAPIVLGQGPQVQAGKAETDAEASLPPGIKTASAAILAARTEAEAGKLAADAAAKGADPAALASAQTELPAAPRGEAATPATPSIHAQSAQPSRIDAPVGSRHWDGEFANRLAWMVTRNEQRAELILNPPQLGRVEVSLSLNGDQASAIFTSANSGVREAIEGALPRLREVLLDAGINLGQTQVGSESPQQFPGRGENRDNSGSAVAAAGPGPDMSGPVATSPGGMRGGNGLVDVFA